MKEQLTLSQVMGAVALGGLSLVAAWQQGLAWSWARVGCAVSRPLWVGLTLPGGPSTAEARRAGGWSVLLLSQALHAAALRLQLTGGSRGLMGWLLALLDLPVAWMSRGKVGRLLRSGQIWLGVMAVTVAAVFLLAAPKANPVYLFQSGGSPWESVVKGAGALGGVLFLLPWLHQVPGQERARRPILLWLGGIALVVVALSALTQGVLGPGVVDELPIPLFTMTGVMGESARLGGLISAVWLIPDLTLAALLARTWRGKWGSLWCAALAFALALGGLPQALPAWVWGAGTLAVGGVTALIPSKER